jgi:hypothetical protein
MCLAILPGGPASSQLAEALPDLRIVALDLDQRPLVDGSAASLTLMLHNASSVVAAGNIAVQVVHDRPTPAPLPSHNEVVYLGADARVEVTFEVAALAMASSPYTFYAVVDVFDALLESNESNNTAWEMVDVCGAPLSAEVQDGFDNDCDGMSDEGLGLSADPDDALRMLRALRRRARFDAVPLLYALPRPFAPAPRERLALLASEDGDFVSRPANAGGGRRGPRAELSASAAETDPRSSLTLVDWNGDELRSGDMVSFRDLQGDFVVAEGGGGGRVLTSTEYHERERLFTLVKLDASGARGDRIDSGDTIALVVSTGEFISAEQGGGGPLRADRSAASGWESFTLILAKDGDTP